MDLAKGFQKFETRHKGKRPSAVEIAASEPLLSKSRASGPADQAEYRERLKATRRAYAYIGLALFAYFAIGVWAGWIGA